MKYLKKFEEVSYLNLHGDDDYEITQVTRDDDHDYEYCDGVLYQLSGREEEIAYIEEITHTEENMFYQDQIDRYKEYINDGGILETFPVGVTKLCENLEEMLEYLDDNDKGFDIMYNLFKSKLVLGAINNQKMYDLYMASYWNILSNPEEYGFSEEYSPMKKGRWTTEIDLSQIKTVKDLDEAYHDYADEEPDKDDYDDKEEYDDAYSDWDEKSRNWNEDILHGLQDIIKYFDDEKEYDLLDSNHRFAALKELGKERVYVEIM